MDVQKNHLMIHSKPRVIDALLEVGIKDPETVYSMYPSQLSGGLNQRVMIAQSILCQPKILIADEPTSAIDASLRKKILNLFREINKKHGMSIIIITHDFDVASYVCDKLVVMYGGLVVETGTTERIISHPRHPYTQALLECAKSLGNNEGRLATLPGNPLSPEHFEEMCPFYSRCPIKEDVCKECIPEMVDHDDGSLRCHLRNL